MEHARSVISGNSISADGHRLQKAYFTRTKLISLQHILKDVKGGGKDLFFFSYILGPSKRKPKNLNLHPLYHP